MFLIRLFIVALCISVSYREAAGMSHAYYALRAQEFLENITKQGELSIPGDLTSYLHQRVENSSALGEKRYCEFNTILSNALMSFTGKRIYYTFTELVEASVGYRVRKELGSRMDERVAEYEQAYASDLQLVTPEEFRKKILDRYNKEDFISMKLDESKKIAEAILLLLDKKP